MNFPTIRPAWTPLNIVLMVLGFIIFWPLGLAMIAWIIWGEQITDKYRDTEVRWHSRKTGNAAFDDYRRQAIERLEAERRRLEDEVHEFEDYLRDLKRARDQEEFDEFLSEREMRRDYEMDQRLNAMRDADQAATKPKRRSKRSTKRDGGPSAQPA